MPRPLKVAVQMDPIEHINIDGDSTFALMLEAQRRGHALWHYEVRNMSLTEGKLSPDGPRTDRLTAVVQPVTVQRVQGSHFTFGKPTRIDLGTMDVVLMRQDPPFDMAYITATHMLEHIHPKTLVVNDPASVRDAPEKLLVTHFPELMPPTLITWDTNAIRAFREEHRDIIVKPLFGNGGAGVFRIRQDDENLASLLEMHWARSREPLMIQRYEPAVRKGDKRVILIDGEPLGAINRVPAAGESRSNMHVGGRPEPVELTARDCEICARIGPFLRERGLLFVGIDVIEVLTPDFLRKPGALEVVVDARPDVFNHNLETVPSKYLTVRPGARYFHSVRLLQRVKELDPTIFTKSGIMVGLGEERHEILQLMDDLRSADVDFLTIGQYLQPTRKHHAVMRFVPPDEFASLHDVALTKGFLVVSASPLTRSSHHAGEDFARLRAAREAQLAGS